MSHLIIPRSDWDAAKPRSRHLIETPVQEAWLHHSAGSGSDEAAVRAIQRFHMAPPPTGRGWSDIAYTYLIDNDPPDVDIFVGRGPGVAGGHTKGRNTISHGYCIIGDFTERPPKDETLEALVWLVAHDHRQGLGPAQLTGGHRDAPDAATSCPGDALWRLIPEINREIERALGRTNDPAPDPGEPTMLLPLHKGDHERGRRSDIAWFQRLINMAFGTKRLNTDGVYGENMASRLVELGVADPADKPADAGAWISGNVAGRLLEKVIDRRVTAAVGAIAERTAGHAPAGEIELLRSDVEQILEGLRIAVEGD